MEPSTIHPYLPEYLVSMTAYIYILTPLRQYEVVTTYRNHGHNLGGGILTLPITVSL